MKLVLAGITLLVATIAVGVGCGPKEKYCYEDMDTCEHVKELDAAYMMPTDGDAEASSGTCFNASGDMVPCGG